MSGLRADFRDPFSYRELSAERNFILEANSSAKFQFGDMVSFAAVCGPAAPKFNRQEHFDRLTVDVDYRILGNKAVSMEDEVRCRQFLRSILESAINVCKYPRSVLSVAVSVPTNDGDSLSAAVNACSIALMGLGISLRCIPVALSLALITPYDIEGGEMLVVDPTGGELYCGQKQNHRAMFTVCYASNGGSDDLQMLNSNAAGVFSVEELGKAISISKAIIRDGILPFVLQQIEP